MRNLQEIAEWQNETFPNATVESKLHHLKEEVEELLETPYDESEYADAFLLLWGAWAKQGKTFEQPMDAVDAKMEINRNREWGNPDENGVIKHK